MKEGGPQQDFPAKLLGAAGKEVARYPQAYWGAAASGMAPSPDCRAAAPMEEDEPVVLAVESRAPTWTQHIVRFLQIGELPEEQEEA